MKKNLIQVLLFSLIFVCMFVIKTNNVFAETKTSEVTVGNETEKTYTSCNLKSTQASLVRIRIKYNTKEKYGFVYNMKLGGQQAFCLIPNKSNETTYKIGAKLNNKKAVDKAYYRIYQWYLENRGNNYNGLDTLVYAQAAIWYFSDIEDEKNLNVYVESDDLGYALRSAYYTSKCNEKEAALKKYFNNDTFSCECFMTSLENEAYKENGKCTSKYDDLDDKGNIQQYAKSSQLKRDENKYASLKCDSNGCIYIASSASDLRLITLEDYIKYFTAASHNYGDYMRVKGELQIFKNLASEILNASNEYKGDLYYWEPPSDSYQRLIGIGGCDGSDKVDNCSTELADIIKKYPKKSETDSEYMKALKKLKEKYSEANINDPSNPSCSTPPPDEPKCDANYRTYSCAFEGGNGGFKMSDQGSADNGYSCYFSKNIAYTTNGESISSVDTELSNEYCTVKCWESFDSVFPRAIKNIKAGTTFFWGTGTPSDGMFGNITATRYCSTTDINYTKFETDFRANEADIAAKYNSYMAQVNYNSQAPIKGDACTISGSCANEVKATKNKKELGHSDNPENDYGCKPNNDCYRCGSNNLWCRDENVPGYCAGCASGYYLKNGSCVKDGTTFKKEEKNVGGQKSTPTKSACIANDSSNQTADANSALNDTAAESNRLSSLNTALNRRAGLKTKINSCQTGEKITQDSIYKFISKVTLNFTDKVARNITSPIALEQRYSNLNFNHDGQDTNVDLSIGCTNTGSVRNYENCPGAAFSVSKFQEYHWNFGGEYYYGYPSSDYFWYSYKETFKLVNSKSYKAGDIAPYTVGYGIPTAFSATTGYYNISVDVQNFGNNGHFNKLVSEKLNGTEVYNYSCPYHVVNKLYGNECNWVCNDSTLTCTLSAESPAYCESKVQGIDLVYRVVELTSNKSKLFPGHNGNGRDAGENWANFIATNNKRFKNIMNAKIIYDNAPIYSIDLTPTLMNQIRNSNLAYRNNGVDPYTSYTDENNHKKIKCDGILADGSTDPEVGTNRTCASDYLTTLINNGTITGEYAIKGTTEERLKHIKQQKTIYDSEVVR